MTQKEKLEEANRLYKTANADQKYVLESLFPELKESDDERIRKGIIKYLSWIKDKDGSYMPNNIPFDEMIAWLEKQGESYTKKDVDNAYIEGMAFAKYELEKHGEHKPAWNEEDEVGLYDAMWAIEQAGTIAKDENDMGNLWYAENWLKSIKGRVQPKQEWSEKDKCMLNNVIGTLKPLSQTTHSAYAINSMIDWLKSLKQRYTWKPSDEQLEALKGVQEGVFRLGILESLYNDLEKLKMK